MNKTMTLQQFLDLYCVTNFNLNEYNIKYVYTKTEAKKSLLGRWNMYQKDNIIANISLDQFYQSDADYIQEDSWKELYEKLLNIDREDISCSITLVFINHINRYMEHIKEFTLDYIDFTTKSILLSQND